MGQAHPLLLCGCIKLQHWIWKVCVCVWVCVCERERCLTYAVTEQDREQDRQPDCTEGCTPENTQKQKDGGCVSFFRTDSTKPSQFKQTLSRLITTDLQLSTWVLYTFWKTHFIIKWQVSLKHHTVLFMCGQAKIFISKLKRSTGPHARTQTWGPCSLDKASPLYQQS